MNVTVKAWRNACVSYLDKRYAKEADLVHEYVEEAEQQDGEAYWMEFATIADACEDFEVYRAFAEAEYSQEDDNE